MTTNANRNTTLPDINIFVFWILVTKETLNVNQYMKTTL